MCGDLKKLSCIGLANKRPPEIGIIEGLHKHHFGLTRFGFDDWCRSEPVWPHLAKFRHFGMFSKYLAIFRGFLFHIW